MRRVEYTAFRGSGKKKLTNYFSDSDLSYFELPAPKKIDLTVEKTLEQDNDINYYLLVSP